MTKLFISTLLVATFSTFAAHAGSSNTSLACSSASGKTVIAGILPGQGETNTDIQYSIEGFFRQFSSESSVDDKNTVVMLNASESYVRIRVQTIGDTYFDIDSKSPETTNLKSSANGISGSFTGLLSGTNLKDGSSMKTPIELRCFVSDEI